MSNASRQKRFRRRQNRGLAVWQIEVHEVELMDALIEAGLVPERATEAEYRRAAAKILDGFVSDFSVTRYSALLARQGKMGA